MSYVSSLARRTQSAFAKRFAASSLASSQEAKGASRMAAVVFILRCASAGLAYGSQIALARWMGSGEYGIFVAVWSLMTVLGTVAAFGLPLTSQRFLAAYAVDDDIEHQRGFVRGSRWVAGGFGMGLGLVCAGAVLLLEGPSFASPYALPVLAALACLPAFAVTAVQEGLARSKDWALLSMVPGYLLRPVLILVAALVLFLAGWPATALTTLVGGIAATWGVALLQGYRLNQRFQGLLGQGHRLYAFRHWLSVSGPILIVEVCDIVILNADVLVLSVYAAPSEVAIYFAATKTLMLAQFVHFAISTAASHRFSAFHAAGDREGLKAFLKTSIQWTFWPTFAATLIMIMLGRFLLSLFGPGFPEAYPVMFLLMLGVLARAAVGPSERLLNMIGRQKECAAIYVAASLVSVGLCFILIPRFGLMGAAGATASALALEALLVYWRVRMALKSSH